MLAQLGSVLGQLVQCWLSVALLRFGWFNFGSVWLMVGSVGLSVVQFRFKVGEVSVHVEDDV